MSDNSSQRDLKRRVNAELFHGDQQFEPARVADPLEEAEAQGHVAQVEVQEEVKQEEHEQVAIEMHGNKDAWNVEPAEEARDAPRDDDDPEHDAFIVELLRDAHDNDSVTSGELARYEQSTRVTSSTKEVSLQIFSSAKSVGKFFPLD